MQLLFYFASSLRKNLRNRSFMVRMSSSVMLGLLVKHIIEPLGPEGRLRVLNVLLQEWNPGLRSEPPVGLPLMGLRWRGQRQLQR